MTGLSWDREPLSGAVQHRSRRQTIFLTVEDLVGRLLYYDRKEDDELPRGAIEEAVDSGEITVAEIVEAFRDEFVDGLSE